MDAGLAAILGALVGAGGTFGVWVLNERSSRRREKRAECEAERLRAAEENRHRVEVSREHSRELLALLRALSDSVAEMEIRHEGIRMTPRDLNALGDEADLIPDALIRRTVRTLRAFLTKPDWLLSRIPPIQLVQLESHTDGGATIRGPLGVVPTSVMQNLAVSTVIEVVSAFAREEDPQAVVSPTLRA